ncbi:MAG: serine/threonine-protein kinase [Victivallaceae bacterium]|jgi:serine/threonine protein kinase
MNISGQNSVQKLEEIKEHLLQEVTLDEHLQHSPEPKTVVLEATTGADGALHEHALYAGNSDIKELTPKPSGKYKFIRSVGFGGMKAVIQVKDRDTTRNVAMAIIPDAADRPQSDINRFVQEARITARLEHPNIVPVHDIGVDTNGTPYFTMKLLRGRTLAAILRKLREDDYKTLKEFDLTRLLRIYVKVLNGVAFAHSKKVIHLDLKPDNIHVGDFGEVLILDWGLARFIGAAEDIDDNYDGEMITFPGTGASSNITLDGITKGTPGYMAPEQAAGKNRLKDERTDIYALGALLYAMLTFESPLSGRPVNEMIAETIHGNISFPDAENQKRQLPAAMQAVVLKAMGRNPEERYQSVDELREDVFAFLGGFAPKAEDASSLKKTYLFVSRNWLATLFLITLLLLIIACSWIGMLYYDGTLQW